MNGSSGDAAILLPLAVAVMTICCTIVIHASAFLAFVPFAHRESQMGQAGVSFGSNVGIIAVVTLTLFTAHVLEIATWALVFWASGEFPTFAPALYHSAMNYTTLGDSLTTMSPSWRLLAPLEATDGMLMFGVSTASLFFVAQRLIGASLSRRDRD